MTESRFFAAFRASLEARETREWGDDVDLWALRQLTGGERDRAEELLLDSLAGDRPDARAARALLEIRSTRAPAALRRALEAVDDGRRVTLAEALAALDPQFDPVPHYLAILHARDWSARAQACGALAGRREDEVVDALLSAVGDDDHSLRTAASQALVRSLRLEPVYGPAFSPLRVILQRLGCRLPSVWREAAGELRDLAARLRAGHTARALGLDEPTAPWQAQVEAFLDVLHDPTRDWAPRSLERLPEGARRTAEAILLDRLEYDDPRLPGALARIGSPRSIAALEEALRLPLQRGAGAAEEALRQLRARHARDG